MQTDVRIVEVGPRDGLQNEGVALPTGTKVAFIEHLLAAGLNVVEAGSFVSARKIPQLADTAEVLRQLPQGRGRRFPVLVPNAKGMQAALDAGAKEVAVFASASETFSHRNINCSIDESIERFLPVMQMALAEAIPVRGYVSCVLGCPYEGRIAISAVVSTARKLADLGCYEISLGDTIGMGAPGQARQVVRAVSAEIGSGIVAIHFHDTRGQALANVLACLEEGIGVIDSAVAGLGGCPYAPGASGNVATEDLIFMLEGLGIRTGVDLHRAAEAGLFISSRLGRVTRSKVAQAMLANGEIAPADVTNLRHDG